jgi:conjugal transfer pilus assembly protein TraW
MVLLLNSFLAISLLTAQAAAAPVIGQTFPIAEPDTLTEIQTRAAKVDWDGVRAKMLQRASAFMSASLPATEHEAERRFDPTYALPRDITDASGKVLFAEGTKVNVYQRVKDPARNIVIADVPQQYQWLKDVAKPTPGDRVLLAGGNVLAARQRTHLNLYLLDQRFIERFGLQHVPSIVQQEGTMLKVHEYVVR